VYTGMAGLSIYAVFRALAGGAADGTPSGAHGALRSDQAPKRSILLL
jgi:hypothetical protein